MKRNNNVIFHVAAGAKISPPHIPPSHNAGKQLRGLEAVEGALLVFIKIFAALVRYTEDVELCRM
jgi:hypothetical protein